MKPIAFFDFDGTITTKDSFIEFIKFYRGAKRFYFGFLLYSPFLIAFKLKLIPNYTAKQKVLAHYFKGEDVSKFQSQCDTFANEVLPELVRPKALTEIDRLKRAGVRVVVVSASAENWIKAWADKQNLELLGTRLEIKDGKITGRIEGKNCYGEEKVCRIKEDIDLADYDDIYAYGDSSGDKQMLALARHAFYKPFRQV
jgi:phosphatidylglycerophosphatase C